MVCPGESLFQCGVVEDGLEGCCGVGCEGPALVEVDAAEKCLVCEPLVLVVAAFIDRGEVSGKVERSVDEGPGPLIVVVMLGDLHFDAVEFSAKPGLELL
ncbi:MAG: hypothetical protein ACTHV4_00555 [Canibacter sp.]